MKGGPRLLAFIREIRGQFAFAFGFIRSKKEMATDFTDYTDLKTDDLIRGFGG
jgi:hypothetical protein